MSIVRDSNISNRPCVIFQDDILTHGWEKAFVLSYINQCIHPDGTRADRKDLHLFFKVISEERLEKILEELIQEGLVVEEEK